MTFENVLFETTCLGSEGDTAASHELKQKLRRVAELQRQVARTSRDASETLHPEQIGALLFQGARLVTASAACGELLGYAVATRAGAPSVCELLVSPRAAGLPVGPALLEKLDDTLSQ